MSKGERVLMSTAPAMESASWAGVRVLDTSTLETMSDGRVSRSTARVVGDTAGMATPSTDTAVKAAGAPRTLM